MIATVKSRPAWTGARGVTTSSSPCRWAAAGAPSTVTRAQTGTRVVEVEGGQPLGRACPDHDGEGDRLPGILGRIGDAQVVRLHVVPAVAEPREERVADRRLGGAVPGSAPARARGPVPSRRQRARGRTALRRATGPARPPPAPGVCGCPSPRPRWPSRPPRRPPRRPPPPPSAGSWTEARWWVRHRPERVAGRERPAGRRKARGRSGPLTRVTRMCVMMRADGVSTIMR